MVYFTSRSLSKCHSGLGLIEEAQFVQTEQYVRNNYAHWDMLGLTTPLITQCYGAKDV